VRDLPANLSSAAATKPTLAAPRIRLTRGSPPGSGEVAAGKCAIHAAEVTQRLTKVHSHSARQPLDDIVVQRLLAAGLDLQGALGLVSDPLVTDLLDRAIGELDQAIRDLRDTIFGCCPLIAESRRRCDRGDG
jgi:hypothetical protein